jgi:hypothetical protein
VAVSVQCARIARLGLFDFDIHVSTSQRPYWSMRTLRWKADWR